MLKIKKMKQEYASSFDLFYGKLIFLPCSGKT